MSKILEFHRREDRSSDHLADIRPVLEDRLGAVQPTSAATEDNVEHHWGVALALASWPICLGAGAVWLTI